MSKLLGRPLFTAFSSSLSEPKPSKHRINMAQITVNSYDEFAAYLGKELGKSEWIQIDQDRINLFAEATLDHQWIHVDTERAKVESPYKSTIAHGYLTLSLLPYLYTQIVGANNIKMLDYAVTEKNALGVRDVTTHTTDESVLFILFKRHAIYTSAELVFNREDADWETDLKPEE